MLSTLREGWRYVRDRRVIVGVLVVTAVANFWGFAYITMVPVIGEQVLGLSAFPIGVLLTVQGIGALLGALRDPPRRPSPRPTPGSFSPAPPCSLWACSASACPRGFRCRSCST